MTLIMSTTAYDHHNIVCSQSLFSREIELLPSVTDGHLGVKCTEGMGVRVYDGCRGGRNANLLLIPRLQSWTKSVKNFALSYSQETHLANLALW